MKLTDKQVKEAKNILNQCLSVDTGLECHKLIFILEIRDARIRAEVFEEAAKEALEPQAVFLTHKNIEDGMLDNNHPVIVARRVMRENIAKRLRAMASIIKKDAGLKER